MAETRNIWSDTRKLIIVLPYKDEVNYKAYRSALDTLLNESKVVELKIIVVLNESVKKDTLQQHKLIHYLSPKDITIFGKVKDENLPQILAQPYDTLLWFDVNEKKIAKILSSIHAIWKIGVNTQLDFFNLRVKSQSQNPSEIVSFAKNTLEKISTI